MLLEMTRAAQAGLRKERQYELITNQLANANTTGYKREILSFDEMMKAKLTTDQTQGDIINTGNTFDLALAGKGYFKVQSANGVRYTRNGNFMLNKDGRIVTDGGEELLATNGPITINGNNVSLNEAGEIFVDGQPLTKLEIVDFKDPEQLQKLGDSLYEFNGNPLDEVQAQNVKVKQGALEGSNIEIVKEMTKLIESNRLYETISNMMKTLDDTDGKINSLGTPSS